MHGENLAWNSFVNIADQWGSTRKNSFVVIGHAARCLFPHSPALASAS